MKLQFDFRFGFLFPWPFRFFGVLLILISIGLFSNALWVSSLLLVIGLLIVFASEGVEIDDAKKIYREYYSLLFIKTGKFKPYNSIEKLFINKSTESQRVYTAHTSKSSIFSEEVFNAYLKFSTGEKILLLRKENKEKLIIALSGISQSLNIHLIDNS